MVPLVGIGGQVGQWGVERQHLDLSFSKCFFFEVQETPISDI